MRVLFCLYQIHPNTGITANFLIQTSILFHTVSNPHLLMGHTVTIVQHNLMVEERSMPAKSEINN